MCNSWCAMELYKFVWVWVWVVVCQDSKVLHTWNSRDARGSCKKNLSQPGFVNFTKKYIIDWLGIWHESFGFRRPHPPFLGNNSICICAGCALVGFGVGLLVTWNSLHRAISWNLQCAICNIMHDGRMSQYWAANMLTVQMQLQGFRRSGNSGYGNIARVSRVYLLMVQQMQLSMVEVDYWSRVQPAARWR